jgi:hypothetical protein
MYQRIITPTYEPPPEERERRSEIDLILDAGDSSLEFLQKVYRNSALPLATRMRAAMAALQFEKPKLGVSLNYNVNDDFAAQLDRAIERSNGGMKLIEGSLTKVEEHPPSEMAEPMALSTSIKRRI